MTKARRRPRNGPEVTVKGDGAPPARAVRGRSAREGRYWVRGMRSGVRAQKGGRVRAEVAGKHDVGASTAGCEGGRLGKRRGLTGWVREPARENSQTGGQR
jgi:hypothetical protein